MSTNLRRFLVLATFSLLFGCEVSHRDGEVIIIQKNVQESFELEHLFSKLRVVELKMGQQTSLGRVGKIVSNGKGYMLLHRYGDFNQNFVTIFDGEGKLKYNLKPADENFNSFSPLDIGITSDGYFEILEGNSNSMWRISVEGQVLMKKRLPFYAANFQFLPEENSYAFYKNERVLTEEDTATYYDILFTDADFTKVAGNYPFKQKNGAYTKINLPFPLNTSPTGLLFFSKPLTDTLFAFNGTSEEPTANLIFDFTYSINEVERRNGINLSELEIQRVLEAGGGVLAGYFSIGNDLLSFNIIQEEGPVWGLLGRSEGNLTLGRHGVTEKYGVIPPFVSYLRGEGFAAVLNESGLSNVPDRYLEDGLAAKVLNNNRAYLIIASE